MSKIRPSEVKKLAQSYFTYYRGKEQLFSNKNKYPPDETRPFWWNSWNINFVLSRIVLHTILSKFSGCQNSVCSWTPWGAPSNEDSWAQSLFPLSFLSVPLRSGRRVNLKNLHFYLVFQVMQVLLVQRPQLRPTACMQLGLMGSCPSSVWMDTWL